MGVNTLCPHICAQISCLVFFSLISMPLALPPLQAFHFTWVCKLPSLLKASLWPKGVKPGGPECWLEFRVKGCCLLLRVVAGDLAARLISTARSPRWKSGFSCAISKVLNAGNQFKILRNRPSVTQPRVMSLPNSALHVPSELTYSLFMLFPWPLWSLG